jgi:pentose-5-phosphate-3-epimerase
MKTNRKLKQKKRVKRKEAHLMSFKLLINNQGQFITELSKYPMDKITTHFKKENAGVIKALLRECDAKFGILSDDLEKIASDVFHS